MTAISEKDRCAFCNSNPTLLVEVLNELKARGKTIDEYKKIIREQNEEIQKIKQESINHSAESNKTELLAGIILSTFKFYVILITVFLLGCFLSFVWLYSRSDFYQAPSLTHHK